MHKSSFSVIFVTQNGKAKADGTVPILARITVNGEMCHFSTRQTILPDRWMSKDYRTIGKTREEKQINAVLDELKSLIIRKYTSCLTSGQVVTASKLKQSIMSLDETSKSYL